ncbi:DUF6011 domain-containing protein [Streptomyces sp. DSM 44917]|uniref:DUF6011 domain-containing protein n=1 Tax=Streptomyces boetiae TaxID=3075541 RepID=A0ABU2L6G7_9ACTN|nr:DUF6011 domain-containing protein [Streptomyces sp. DSM 44917]MDT0306848.1 DUF6011 domain-containing protein [Streptomyces sp. DSM 44917]
MTTHLTPANFTLLQAEAALEEHRRGLDGPHTHLARVQAALEADPGTARRRFADFAIRCCHCGRTLHDDASKVFGIGPECRKGLSPQALAAIFAPAVAQAHAAHEHDRTAGGRR